MILGATSRIAAETANVYAAEGASLLLAGRREAALRSMARDLRARGAATVDIAVADLVAETNPSGKFAEFLDHLPGADHILLAYGLLGDERRAEHDPRHAREIVATNFTSTVGWIMAATAYLEQRRAGSLIVLGSLSGDRVRGTMLLYGAAKAGLAALVQGIANRLARCGACAVLVKPGPTETPMTRNLRTPRLLRSTPAKIARIVHRAAVGRRTVVYAPGYWRWIMLVARLLPARVFRRAFA
jgi:short-subunit dehydrogenase